MTARRHLPELADFVASTDVADLPDEVVDKTVQHMLDTLGAALAGASEPVTGRMRAAFHAIEPVGASPVWGTASMLAPRTAALLNGFSAHLLELDDTGGCDHSGAVVVPAMLAAAATPGERPSGADAVVALVMGYEAGRRLLESFGGYEAHNGLGWHSTGTCGAFGAAATVARLWRMDADQTASALGLAAGMSSGLWAFVHDGAPNKPVHAGQAAQAGLTAAVLVQGGIRGPAKVLEDVWGGVPQAFAPSTWTPEALTDQLGRRWAINRCSLKPYASCRGTHSAIDAVGRIADQLDLAPGSVRQVRVRLSPFLNGMCGATGLETVAAAQLSLPYAIAARLAYGDVDPTAFTRERRLEPVITRLLDRVALEVDPSMDADEHPVVTVSTSDGTESTQQVRDPLGSPSNPMPTAQVNEKFRALATRTLPGTQVEALQRAVSRLPDLAEVATVGDLLRVGAQPHRPVSSSSTRRVL